MSLKYPNVKGIFHSYSGSSEMARELIKRGWYISFSGVVTFKNANRVREVLSTIPLDRLLIETDAPYLAPHPMRGKLNHSGYLSFVLSTLAQIWNCTPEEAAEQTYQNARTFFHIS
jgi:TatD DNase family protein